MRSGGGNAGELREGFGQDHAGNEWITRKVTCEHRLMPGKACRSFGGMAGLTGDDFAHKPEGLAVWQSAERLLQQVAIHSRSRGVNQPLTKYANFQAPLTRRMPAR